MKQTWESELQWLLCVTAGKGIQEDWSENYVQCVLLLDMEQHNEHIFHTSAAIVMQTAELAT